MGFRWPEEPPDGRPVIVMGSPFASESERLAYEYAVEENPRGRNEGVLAYITRIAETVEQRKLPPPGRPFPKAKPVRLPYREQEDEAMVVPR